MRNVDVIFWTYKVDLLPLIWGDQDSLEPEETEAKMDPWSGRGRWWHFSDRVRVSKGTETRNISLKNV